MNRLSMRPIVIAGLLMLLSLACNLQVNTAPSNPDGGNSASDTTPPVIQNLTVSGQTVYYNEQGCGPTTLTLSMNVGDDSGLVNAVGVQYRLVGSAANSNLSGSWLQAPFTFVGNGKFTATIDIGQEAKTVLKGQDGALVYQVYAIDPAGNAQTEPVNSVYSLNVKACVGGQASSTNVTVSGNAAAPPPPPSSGSTSSTPPTSSANTPPTPPGNNNASAGNSPPPPSGSSGGAAGSSGGSQAALQITKVEATPKTAYYNGCTTQPTTVKVQAWVNDKSRVTQVDLNYSYTSASHGSALAMSLDPNTGTYTATIDVDLEANPYLQGGSGQLEIAVGVHTTDGKYITSSPIYVTVQPCTALGQPPQPPQQPQQPPAAQPISIGTPRLYPNPVYYGLCMSGEETLLRVEATIDPLNQIASAVVRYDYGQGLMLVASYTRSVSMYQLGIGDYAADIDVGNDLFGQMSGDGWIEGVIEVTDLQGQTTTSAVFSTDVRECQTVLLPLPSINYFTGPSGNIAPGDSYTLQWDTSDAVCGVFLDGMQVNESGSQTLTAPADNVYQAWAHTLVARGGDCSNPDEVSESVQITVEPLATMAKGSGTLNNNYSLDLGDGNGDDIIFSHTADRDTELYSVWGTQLAVWYGGQPSVSGCKTYVDSGAYTVVTITLYDVVCYKTGSGNYGYLTVTGFFLDLNNYSTSSVDISYVTEIAP